jgi:hypothetical protein
VVTEFHFVGLKAWKTVLFCIIAGLIPFSVYLLVWQSLDLYQELHYNSLFSKLVPITILLTLGFIAKGFYASLNFVRVNFSEQDCKMKFNSPLRLFIPKYETFRWDEVLHYDLVNDIGMVSLTIYLTGNREISTSHSLLLKGEDDFKAFVSTINQNTGL